MLQSLFQNQYYGFTPVHNVIKLIPMHILIFAINICTLISTLHPKFDTTDIPCFFPAKYLSEQIELLFQHARRMRNSIRYVPQAAIWAVSAPIIQYWGKFRNTW